MELDDGANDTDGSVVKLIVSGVVMSTEADNTSPMPSEGGHTSLPST